MIFDVTFVVPGTMTMVEFNALLDAMAPGKLDIHAPGFASNRIVAVLRQPG